MDKAEFDRLFDDFVTAPLARASFQRSGKTLVSHDDLRTVALVRLGGRMSLPGCVSHVLCFRHSFLRDYSETRPRKPPTEPNVYPFKFCPSQLQRLDESQWRYAQPQNFGYDYDTLDWHSKDQKAARTWLRDLAGLIVDRFVPWTRSLTPSRALEQIVNFGEQAWCERLWVEDYTQHLTL